MTYMTGAPIIFVGKIYLRLGTGQTYTDLKRISVENVIDTLMES